MQQAILVSVEFKIDRTILYFGRITLSHTALLSQLDRDWNNNLFFVSLNSPFDNLLDIPFSKINYYLSINIINFIFLILTFQKPIIALLINEFGISLLSLIMAPPKITVI